MTESREALKRAVSSPRVQAILVAALVFGAFLFPLWWQSNVWLHDRFIADEKNSGQQSLDTYRDMLDASINQDYAILNRFSGYIQAHPSEAGPTDLAGYAGKLTYPGEIRNITLKHKGDPVYSYVPDGRNATLPSGETQLQMMKLIYTKGRYWGYATVTVDTDVLMENTGSLFSTSGMEVVVLDQKGTLVTGDPGVLSRDPLIQDLFIPPDRSWKIGLSPKGGWETAIEQETTWFRNLGFLIITLVALLVGLITYRQAVLRRDIRERTESLQETNARFQVEIEDHMRTEKALVTSRKKYFTLFNSANDVMAICARQENPLSYPMIEVNDCTCRVFGYSRECFLSCKLFDHVLPGSRERIPGIIDEIERNGYARFEIDFLTYDGSVLPLEMNAHQFTLEGEMFLLAAGRDISARKRVEYELRQSLAEKEVLLKEVHHRVKNNLQVITSLIDLQSLAISDPAAQKHFRECQDRIRSMALVHENLYQSKNFSTIKAKEYIKMLVDHLIQSCSPVPGISVRYDLDDIELDLDTAVPCGFVINELVTNALRHAFTGRDKGIIRISLKRVSGTLLTLTVEDDGTGFPETINFRDTESLGLQIVTALSRQIDGDVSMVSGTGTKFVIRFSVVRGKTGV